jgi:hypothetical protein
MLLRLMNKISYMEFRNMFLIALVRFYNNECISTLRYLIRKYSVNLIRGKIINKTHICMYINNTCFGRHVKPLVQAAFADDSTHQLGPRGGLWPVLLLCNP